MKTITHSLFIITLALALLSPGCKKADAPTADAGPMLQQAFESAGPGLKKSTETVVTNLKAKNYTEATKALEPIAFSPSLTEPQKQAVMTAIRQISDAVTADPKLDAPEMSALRARMFSALRRGSR
jgi:hypothetical protein